MAKAGLKPYLRLAQVLIPEPMTFQVGKKPGDVGPEESVLWRCSCKRNKSLKSGVSGGLGAVSAAHFPSASSLPHWETKEGLGGPPTFIMVLETPSWERDDRASESGERLTTTQRHCAHKENYQKAGNPPAYLMLIIFYRNSARINRYLSSLLNVIQK